MRLDSPALLRAPRGAAGADLLKAASSPRFSVYLTRERELVLKAQRLRHAVFCGEMGAHLASQDGVDRDIYDDYCDHLVVCDNALGDVVGTYRILPYRAATRLGFYSDSEFFTNRLDSLKPDLCEFGRSCVHPAYRTGPVIMQLWAGLAQYMVQEGYEHVIGCASVSMNDGGAQAASLYRALLKNGLAEHQYRVFPRQPVRFERLSAQCDIAPPPLIRGYLRLGAKVCGEPAFDADFNSADFFMLLSLASMNPRYARHFGVRSAS